MEIIESFISKIYENHSTGFGTEEESLKYLQVIEQHRNINAIIGEYLNTSIKISTKSWYTIIKLIPEEKKYSLSFICFSTTNEIEENEIWSIKKTIPEIEEKILNLLFFNPTLEPSTPNDIPFVMCNEDFSIITDYFNQEIEEEVPTEEIKQEGEPETKIIKKKILNKEKKLVDEEMPNE